MTNRVARATVFFLVVAFAADVFGRAGGGCFEEGTPVLTPKGEQPIESLRIGDEVIGGTVQAVIRTEPESFVELESAGRIIHVTDEHPFEIAPGVFREAGRLPGARQVPARRAAYNLLVSPGGTFVASGRVVHNKGCFLADTRILRSDGSEVWIRAIKAGDHLMAFDASGKLVSTAARNIVSHDVEEFLVVSLEHCVLRVTLEHPFYVGNGTFKTLVALGVGDHVYAYDGHGLNPQRIESIERIRSRVRVYNLQTDFPNTFFANRIAVHNKGGCFPPGTGIRTRHGDIPIERIRIGDEVLSGGGQVTVVQGTYVTRARMLTLITDTGTLRTTAEHPVLCADGTFHEAGTLARGDRLESSTISALQNGSEGVVYNLRVDAPHTFVADGFVMHNKGGCFPAGVMVETPESRRAIETLCEGDDILGIAEDGRRVVTKVRHVFETTSPTVTIRLADGTVLRTTDEHPLATARAGFRIAEQIEVGERLLVVERGHTRTSLVVEKHADPAFRPVFNLEVGDPHTFIADGVVVHNKGGFHGGGFHGSGGHGAGNGSPGIADVVVMVVFVGGVATFVLLSSKKSKTDEDLDFVYGRSAIDKKAVKTNKLLEFIARTDQSFAPDDLKTAVEAIFLKAQQSWQSRDYEPMRSLLFPDLYKTQVEQLAALIRNHEINVIADLDIDRIDIVNVRYTHKPNDREFTALITATSTDYYIDDRSQEFVRGDREPAKFQEFWTFQWQDGKWLLRDIEQSRESDALKDENFFEPFTDTGRDQIYGDVAGSAGPAGPWLEKDVATKATRIERLLNFLVQTDKIWDRQKMLERSRDVFMKVMLARESGNVNEIPADALMPNVTEALRNEIEHRRVEGRSIEYRNLCIRKAELILVRNYLDRAKDEFTARISAHAQTMVKKNGQTVRADEYVTPFEVFCVFGRDGNQWKLREILPPSQNKNLVQQENVDEDSSPQQLEWYYAHTRAN